MQEIYLYLGLYVLLLIVVSYFVGRGQNKEDFLISGRNRGGIQIMLSKFAGAIGAGYFITYTGFAYEYGYGVFAMLVGIIFGYLLFAYWASPKIYKNSREKKFYLMGDYVYDRTKSNSAAQLTNVLSNVILFFWLLVGVIGGAKIISDFGFISYGWAVFLTTFVILVYLLMAGFKAVIITDVIQSIVILLLLAFITFGVVSSGGVVDLFSFGNTSIDIGTAVGFFLFGLLGIFSYSNMFQLCYAAKSRKNLVHGMGMSFVPITFVAFLLLIIGVFMAQNSPGIDSGLVFSEALKNFLPVYLLPWGIVLFFAGIMSSADTNIYGIASHYSIPKQGDSVKHIKIAAFIVVVITACVALIFSDVVDVSILTAGLTLTLSFPIIYLLSGGRNSGKFIASAVFGLVGLILSIAIFGLEPVAAIVVILGGLLGLLWKK